MTWQWLDGHVAMHADWIKLSGQIKLKKKGKLLRGPPQKLKILM